MNRPLPAGTIASLAQAACLIEASAPKPGNVTPQQAFADTTYEDFLLSAAAIGPAFLRAPDVGVGATVLQAVRDTRRLVRVNTNLGIVLLLAPLARAAGSGNGRLREGLSTVLGSLTLADARDVFAAIRLAAPGGRTPWEYDVARYEAGLSFTPHRYAVLKAAFQHNRRAGGHVREQSFLAGQVLLWF